MDKEVNAVLTKTDKFCLELKKEGVTEITLFDLSQLFLDRCSDPNATIKELYDSAVLVGIKVRDCAWEEKPVIVWKE